MPNPIVTAIGRVQPIYKGNWVSGTLYKKLDNVYCQGNTYVCTNDITDEVKAVSPSILTTSWQLVASKGDTGGIGSVTASASALPMGEPATVTASVYGDDPTARNFSFVFGLPKGDTGPVGIITATASARALAAGADPTVNITLNSDAQSAHFSFGLPAADGQGVALVDGEGPTGSARNVILKAVKYTAQTLTDEEKTMARVNIGAQASGNYITAPASIENGQFIKYDNGYTAATIYTIPAGGAADVGKALVKLDTAASSYGWSVVHQVPAGGSIGAVLTKANTGDWEISWESAMTSAEVDAIIGTITP